MKRLLLFAAFFVLFALLACGGGEEPSSEQPPPPATNTPVLPTDTPVPRPIRRCSPTDTPVPRTDTPVSVPHFTVNSEQVNVRTGPGTAFSIIGTVEQGDRFDIGGRNVDGDWLEFCCVNGQRGWIYAQLLIVSQETTSIPLAQNIPLPPLHPPTRPCRLPTRLPLPRNHRQRKVAMRLSCTTTITMAESRAPRPVRMASRRCRVIIPPTSI